jgi:multidrug resistance efflux pump
MKILKSVLKLFLTLSLIGIAGWYGWGKVKRYFENPWTRDGQVRTQVIQVAPRVSGMIVKIHVHDNQFVHRGDPLFDIDRSSYVIKLRQAEAQLKRAKETSEGSRIEYERVLSIAKRDAGAVSKKDLNRNRVNYLRSLADIDVAKERLRDAKLNLSFTKVVAPVDGWVSNINFQIGTQAVANQPIMALVDRESFWVFAFFREDRISEVHTGDRAVVTLMAYPQRPLKGRVESIAWGIAPSDGNPGYNLLPSVKPVFQWIRLAQRIPVRIALDPLPDDIKLRVGMTASIMILAGDEKEGRGE